MPSGSLAKAAGAKDRAYKLFDQGGLHLFVARTGTKSWRLKYRMRGREKLLTIGRFPEVSLAQARIRQAEAKEQLGNGVDPSKASDKLDTFEQLGRSWYRHGRPGWSEAHAVDVIGSLERDIFPELGRQPASEVAAPALLELLRKVQARGSVATAQRIRQRLSEIFAFGMAQGLD